VLPGGALPVVLAADDEAAAPVLDARAEVRIACAQREFGDRGHVGAIRHDFDAVGREVAGGDVVVLDGQ